MMVRAWFAAAGWAFLCGIAAQLFITSALVGLFLLFFGALVSAFVVPIMLWLGVGDWSGWNWVVAGVGVWALFIVGSGWVTRWAFRRCRAVVFPETRGATEPGSTSRRDVALVPGVQWSLAQRTAVLAGFLASFVFLVLVPRFDAPGLSGVPATPAERPDARPPIAPNTV